MSNILSNIIGSIISAILLTLIFFVWNDYVYKSKDLSGAWSAECEVLETSYTKYKGMKVYFDVLINQQGDQIIGTGEKVADVVDGIRTEYEAENRVRIELNGVVENRFIADDEVRIHYIEHGMRRDSTTILTLRVENISLLKGAFLSTAANSKGRVTWRRKI